MQFYLDFKLKKLLQMHFYIDFCKWFMLTLNDKCFYIDLK